MARQPRRDRSPPDIDKNNRQELMGDLTPVQTLAAGAEPQAPTSNSTIDTQRIACSTRTSGRTNHSSVPSGALSRFKAWR